MLTDFWTITPKSYYWIKDLKQVYYACHGLPFGIIDQTLLIDDEPNNLGCRIQNARVFSSNPSWLNLCQGRRYNGWTLHLACKPTWWNWWWQPQFEIITTSWWKILNHVWVLLCEIILGFCNIWTMTILMFAMCSHF